MLPLRLRRVTKSSVCWCRPLSGSVGQKWRCSKEEWASDVEKCRLVSVRVAPLSVFVHHRPAAGLGPAIAEIEPLADLDGGELRGVVADRRRHRPALPFWWLESDDVVEGALAARHLAVGQSAVEALELLEARDTLQHFGT